MRQPLHTHRSTRGRGSQPALAGPGHGTANKLLWKGLVAGMMRHVIKLCTVVESLLQG